MERITSKLTRAKMKNANLILFMALLLAGCGGSAPADGGTNQGSDRLSTQAVKADDSRWEVNVTRNGAVVASYKQVGARGVGAIFDGKLIQMYLASPLTVAASAVAGYIVEYEPSQQRELAPA